MPTAPRHDDESAGQRLLAAFAVSLLMHTTFFAVAQLGAQLNWWDAKPFAMFRKVRFTPEELAELQERQRRNQEQVPTIFVQVSQPSEDKPTETALYSSVSSRAANPDPTPGDQPKIDGRQTQTLRTEDAPRVPTGRPTPPAEREAPGTADASPQTAASRATPNPEQVAKLEVPKLLERPPEPARSPGLGELALPTPLPLPAPVVEAVPPEVAKPPEKPPEVVQKPVAEPGPDAPAPRARPRTVTEAKVRQSLLAGEKSKQDGGVNRKGPVSLDVKGVPFGAYDEALIMAVQNRWFALLDEQKFAGGARGKVVVKFNLHADGSVRIVEPHESTLDDMLLTALCVRAIRDPSPYEKWPSDMMRMIGSNMREMRFTFFYN